MSGRGRGRGRGAPPSGAKLLLMRSAQESGLDDHNLKSLNDITKPALFPDMHWNYAADGTGTAAASSAGPSSSPQSAASKQRHAQTMSLINKGREMDHRMSTSSHWVRPSQTQVDVVRYHANKKSHNNNGNSSSNYLMQQPDLAVLDQMGTSLGMDELYTPADLVPALQERKRLLEAQLKAQGGSAKKKPALDELAKKEFQTKVEEMASRGQLRESEEGDALNGGVESDAPPEDEEEEVEDYTKDYYESEEESDGGGDAEATF